MPSTYNILEVPINVVGGVGNLGVAAANMYVCENVTCVNLNLKE